MTSGVFSDHSKTPGIGDVQCSGTESELLQCAHSGSPGSSCQETDDAGVVCQGSSSGCHVLDLYKIKLSLVSQYIGIRM